MPLPPLIITGITGRNGIDPPELLRDDECADAFNVEFIQRGLVKKRAGSTILDMTAATVDSVIKSMLTHTPSTNVADSELWIAGVDGAPGNELLNRRAAAVWSAPSMIDAMAALQDHLVEGASLNGLFFLCYDSAVDRLHVWDGSTVRRVGLQTPSAAPTVANTGGGAYAAIIRYYKVAWLRKSGSTVLARSELSAVVSFTPSGAGTAARVTRPTAPSEGETHWELYGSATGTGSFTRLGTDSVIATTFYDDTALPSTYSGFTVQPLAGANTVPTSWRYIRTDGNRLIGAGSFETGGYSSRVWFTPVLGTSNGSTITGDLERIPQTTDLKYYVDCDEHEGGGITGLSPPMEGAIYVFKFSRIYRLVPTGDVNAPYQRITISNSVGCPWHRSIVLAEDEHGQPCLYFLSADGPYRLGASGLQYCGHDVEDLWTNANVNDSIGTLTNTPHGLYVRFKKQVRWWVATDSVNTLDKCLVFDVRFGQPSVFGVVGGWAQWELAGDGIGDEDRGAKCSVLFGSVASGLTRLPRAYIATNDLATILEQDTSANTDNTVVFQGYAKSKAYAPAGLNRTHSMGIATLYALAGSGITMTLSVIRDFAAETRTFTALLTAAGSETRVVVEFEASETQDATVTQYQIGDSAAVSNRWTLDALIVPVNEQALR